MTDYELSENEYVAKDQMPATTAEIAESMNVSHSYVWDLVDGIRNKGFNVSQDSEGRYYIPGEHELSDDPYHIEALRQSSESKAAKTRKIKAFLAETEHQLLQRLTDTEPAVADGGLDMTDGNQDVVIHRTDDHFGAVEKNQNGDETFNSEIAESRVNYVFDETRAIVESRRDAGYEFDTAHVLLGGDIITNEAIYEGQPHEIDENLHAQIDRASRVYINQIKRLTTEFPTVQVVCQPGNHGRIGSGNPTNADSLLYMMMDKATREADIDNLTFLQNNRSYYTNFSIRDWNAHLRHGHDASLAHIGTSAAQHRWQTWLIDHGFDVAFRGHYHTLKEEPINGVPVIMGGSISPQTEFEESQALSGRAISAIHGASDGYPLEWTERITFT